MIKRYLIPVAIVLFLALAIGLAFSYNKSKTDPRNEVNKELDATIVKLNNSTDDALNLDDLEDTTTSLDTTTPIAETKTQATTDITSLESELDKLNLDSLDLNDL